MESKPETGKMLDRGILKDYKTCPSCAKPFTRRSKWREEERWIQVKFCSDSCRRKKCIKSSQRYSGCQEV